MPEFFELLVEQQEQFTKAITGQQDAKETLDNIAAFQEKLLTRSRPDQIMTPESMTRPQMRAASASPAAAARQMDVPCPPDCGEARTGAIRKRDLLSPAK